LAFFPPVFLSPIPPLLPPQTRNTNSTGTRTVMIRRLRLQLNPQQASNSFFQLTTACCTFSSGVAFLYVQSPPPPELVFLSHRDPLFLHPTVWWLFPLLILAVFLGGLPHLFSSRFSHHHHIDVFVHRPHSHAFSLSFLFSSWSSERSPMSFFPPSLL